MTVVIILLSLTVSVVLGWMVVEGVMHLTKVRGGADPRLSSGGHRATVLREWPAQPRVLCGGAWINALERLAITGTILAHQPEMVATVVVMKRFGHWTDLRTNPAPAERFVTGTLALYVVAGAYGYVGLALMD